MLAKVVNFPGRRANTNAAIELTKTTSVTETTVRIVELMNALITTPSLVSSTVFTFCQSRNFSGILTLNWYDSLEFLEAVRNIRIKGAAKTKSPTGTATKSIQFLRRNFFMLASPSY
jgi:hypothetical protein